MVINMTTSHITPDSHTTLYVMQCTYARINSALQELQAIWQSDDILLLLEDAVFALQHNAIRTFKQVYILQSDTHLLTPDLNDKINIIDYSQFAELIHSAHKVHTWK